MATITELRSSTSDGSLPRFAWPGGYPIVYYIGDGLVVCRDCAEKPDTSDDAVAGEVYWEGPTIPCDDCGTPLESAYGDPDAPEHPHN